MSLERNTLMEQVYPRLKDYCREKHGLEFQVVDMRWGVRDEATDDHMTTELCMKEIKNCQRLSMGPNFVVFLGQKYGYRPIPTYIDGEEFVLFRDTLKKKNVDVSLLNLWYKEDTNSVPSVYVLQPISSILTNFNNKKDQKLQSKDQATWWDTLSKLQILLRRAAQSLFAMKRINEDAMHNYMMSVTEREVINGILNVLNTRSTCLAYVRQINNINMTFLREVCKFVDMTGKTVDMEAQNLLGDLRDRRLLAKMKKPNYIKFSMEWDGKDGLNAEVHHDYLVEFTHHFFKHIKKLVDKAMQRAYLTQQSPVVTEMLQHLHMCNDVVKVFQGRVKELQKIQDYIEGNSSTPLVLHGIGGCGKTSLLAKAASLVTSWIQPKSVLVLRFIGTTPDSSTLLPLVTTVCQQIAYNYNQLWQEMPGEILPLVAHLKRLLRHATAEYPLYIFIDSLDQLSGSNNALKVTWLPIILPPHVKMVITADSDDDSPTFSIIQKMYEEESAFLEVKPLHPELAVRVLKIWLAENKRTLKDHQWKLVKSVISKCSLPIFVKLVYAEVCRWKSYTPEKDTLLTSTVVESIMNFVEKVEIQHGRILVAHAFAYITASKSGLSEIELEDLISLDDIVLEDVYQYHLPPVRRIPPLLWTRIRNDIPSYLSEREADGIIVLNWYHRQFRNAAYERYLSDVTSLRFYHSSIADYFLGTWGGGKSKPFKYSEIQRIRFCLYTSEGEADRKVPSQPLVFESNEVKNATGIRYNFRKMSELPFHLIRANRKFDLFREVLFNYSWLYCKLCSFPISAVLADFEDAKENLNERERDTLRELTLVADSLRLGRSVLADYPQMVGPQITGRLLPVKDHHKNIKSLILQCDESGPKNCGLIPAYHCLHTPGGPMKYSLEGHPFAVFGFCVTSDSRYVISASNRFIICNVTTSDITQDIDPGIEGIMMDVVRTDDDKYAIAYTNYNTILLLNILNGDVEKISLKEKEKEGFITGLSFGYSFFAAWSDTKWFFFRTSTGDLLEEHVLNEKNASVLSIKAGTLNNYDMIVNMMDTRNGKCNQVLKMMKERNVISSLAVDGALVFNNKRSKVFLVEKGKDEVRNISLYTRLSDGWSFDRTVIENVPQVLALSLDDQQELLCAVLTTKFVIWYISSGTRISYCLPETVRNISTKPLQAQSSVIVTQNNQFVVGAVRKRLYIWSMKNGLLLRVLDAHFGRILNMKSLKLDDFNGFVTSSLDRSLKVWNVRNLFEESHVIDRMDMSIESISMDRKSTLAVTMTRSSIGVWNLVTGKLIVRLSDSQVGAIITHAFITADGRFIPCIESGLFIVWSIENQSVHCRERQGNVINLSMTARDTRALILTKEHDLEAQITCRSVPDGGTVFCVNFPVNAFRYPVVTANGTFLVISTTDKGDEILAVYNPRKGNYLYKFPVPKGEVKSFKSLVPIPSASPLIGLLEDYKVYVLDVNSKKILRVLNRCNGIFSRNGKLGLYAPPEGGLDILELKHGKPLKTLLGPVTEGIFSVKTFFSTNKYVIYYHTRRNSIRVFRIWDGKMIANYKLSSEIHALEGSPDGHGVVVGGVDGTLTLLSIVDTDDPETQNKLMELPSRMDADQAAANISVTFRSAARQVMRATLPIKS